MLHYVEDCSILKCESCSSKTLQHLTAGLVTYTSTYATLTVAGFARERLKAPTPTVLASPSPAPPTLEESIVGAKVMEEPSGFFGSHAHVNSERDGHTTARETKKTVKRRKRRQGSKDELLIRTSTSH